MIAGHLTTKNGYWYMILQLRDSEGHPKQKWIATHLKEKGNKRHAQEMLLTARIQYTDFNNMREQCAGLLLSHYLINWVANCNGKVALSTYAGYLNCIKRHIAPYFEEKKILLSALKPADLQDYYNTLYAKGLSGNTVLHYHVLLRKALSEACMRGLIPMNPADCVDRPRKDQFIASCYSVEECQQLLQTIKGDPLELPITLSILYGLRRSEVLGLKWGAINYNQREITMP